MESAKNLKAFTSEKKKAGTLSGQKNDKNLLKSTAE